MAETINLPAIGDVKKPYFYGGLAVAGAFVAYAWYRRKQNNLAPVYVPDPATGSDTGQTTYQNPAPEYSSFPDGQSAPQTDQEWAARVNETLTWYEPGYLSSILGKYLSRQGLTTEETAVIREAWAYVGKPPSNQNIVQIGTTNENVNDSSQYAVAKTWWDLDQWITWLKSLGYDTSYEKLAADNPALSSNVDSANRFINPALYNVGSQSSATTDTIISGNKAIVKTWWDLDQWLTRLAELGYNSQDVLDANPGLLDNVDSANRFVNPTLYNLPEKNT